jgi:spermidine synthase
MSYIFDISIEKRQSEYSGEVQVSLSQGQYKLSTQNAIYSFGKNYTSFDVAFKSLDIQHQPIENVLVLGFGLGSVVDLLESHPVIKEVTAVDADAVIMDLAKKYLQSSLKSKTIFIGEDAVKFVNNTHQVFDLVLFDVFIQDETPMPFMQKDFLLALKKLVHKNGILLYSKIDDSNKSKIENMQFESIFTSVFNESFSIDTNGNKVFTWINN